MEICKKESIIKSNAYYDKDNKPTHRFLLERIWDNNSNKKMAAVILYNPSYASELKYDNTTGKVTNYLVERYNGIYFLNLFSKITEPEYKLKKCEKEECCDINDRIIEEVFKKSSAIYTGWGQSAENSHNAHDLDRIEKVKQIMKKCGFQKYYELVNENNKNIHPSRIIIKKENAVILK
nr:DUF1643 domain-containing protein [Clostridium paraputrificum]